MAELRPKIRELLSKEGGGLIFDTTPLFHDDAFEAFLDDVIYKDRPDNLSKEVCIAIEDKIDFMMFGHVIEEAMDHGVQFKILLINPSEDRSIPFQDIFQEKGCLRVLKDFSETSRSFILFANEHFQFKVSDGRYHNHAFIRQNARARRVYDNMKYKFDSMWNSAVNLNENTQDNQENGLNKSQETVNPIHTLIQNELDWR